MKSHNLDDTIVAISTAIGQGAIGIVRLSGNEALTIADGLFFSNSGKKPSEFKNFTVHYGWVMAGKDKIIDEALLTVMRAPKSYTKEDMVEISCHGGIVSVRAILTCALDLGARLAEPGEFTKRAFLNGRIDLAQAEAVLDIIQSKTEDFLRVSTSQLKGELSAELESIREQLMNAYIEIEAFINFPEDDINAAGREKILSVIETAKKRVEKLLLSSEQGRILKEGIKVVICGRPNVGKSSLLNVLLKTPRAIVSAVAGTTRDTIEETAQIRGIPFQLIDTAGILEPRDFIEEEAVKRSQLSIQSADLILLVVDSNSLLTKEDQGLMQSLKGKNVLVVLNKSDLPQRAEESSIKKIFSPILKVSARTNKGIEQLEEAIVQSVWHGQAPESSAILVSNMRHIESLKRCQEALKGVERVLPRISLEFSSEEIKRAVNFLDNITGRNLDADLLDNIFSQFCIGK